MVKMVVAPRNGIRASAYAAKAAMVIGVTVAGTVTSRLFMKLRPSPRRPSTSR